MLKAYIGDQKDEGRMRIGDTGPSQIIQWISKAWTTHELTLPVRIPGKNTIAGEVQELNRDEHRSRDHLVY